MNYFSKHFKYIIEQDINDMEAGSAAATAALDTTSTEDLGATGIDQSVLQAAAQQEQKMVQLIKDWIGKIDEFTDFLNDPNRNDSIQTILKNAIPDTVLDKIRTTETKKISRTAMDLASLAESLKGYLSTSSDPKYRFK